MATATGSSTTLPGNPPQRARADSKALFLAVALWIVVSSLYYVNTLLTGQFAMERDEGLVHKAFKYAATLGLSLLLVVRLKTWLTLAIPALLSVQALYLRSVYPATSGPIVDVHIVLICMSGLVGLLRALGHYGNSRLPFVIVATGGVVGLISMVEIFVLNELFADRWAATGGLRSISTLFNPNNLGLYLGTCAIFLLGVHLRPLTMALAGVPIGFGLVFSGSRTAWIALAAVVLCSAVYSYLRYADSRQALLRPRLLAMAAAAGCAVWLASFLFGMNDDPQVELTVRDFDPYTADLRVQHLLQFLGDIGWHSLMPDAGSRNIELTTDSSYLILLNSLGLIPLVVLLAVLATLYRIDTRSDMPHGVLWRYVLLFYLVAALADSTINAFPNNELFFIACGSLLNYRFAARRPPC
jgi:hypothetical protein